MSNLEHFLRWLVGMARPETQTTQAERDCLAAHAAGKQSIAEIGVWHGVTTCQLRAVMAHFGTLFAVDPYPVGRLGFSIPRFIAHHECSKVAGGQIVWIRARGVQASERFQRAGVRLDFVFIDGDHSYEGLEGDWTSLTPLISEGGIVALHDSRSYADRQIDDSGSVLYTKSVVLKDSRFEVIQVVDSLTLLRRARIP